jgi:2-beta-glucuronyltransferase
MSTNPLFEASNNAVIFSFHSMGFGTRKNSVVFLAEGLAELGWRIDLVTAQLSLLSELAGVPRLRSIPRDERNTWLERTPFISTFVWIPAIHPATTRYDFINRLATPLFRLYPYLLPESVRRRVRSARLIIIESCSAAMLFPLLKRLAPKAKFVYRACDSLAAIGMHPVISEVQSKTAGNYDLLTSPSNLLLADYPPYMRTCLLPQGLQKALFDEPIPSPFVEAGPHAIIAGDMMFDRPSFEIMVQNFPNITFHTFGRMDLGELTQYENLSHHGEVPFEELRSYIVHADLGIAPYIDRSDVHYLAESSLKLVQYTYARLPIVAPYFCKGDREHLKDYRPGEEASITRAVGAALQVERRTIDRSGVRDWQEIAGDMLAAVGLHAET